MLLRGALICSHRALTCGRFLGSSGYIRLKRYASEPCGWDPDPLMGVACEIGELKSVYACGECGVAWWEHAFET